MSTSAAESPRLLCPVQEACAALSVGRTTIYRLMGERELDVVKIGARTLVTADSLTEYVARHRTTARECAPEATSGPLSDSGHSTDVEAPR